MTDPTPPPDDELVSAVLDGEATAEDQARVEADPAARERLAELRAVRDLVAAPVPVPGAARERAMAAALAEFDALAAATGSGPSGRDEAPSDELASRRARRGSGGRGGRFLAAAAAVVVLVLGVGVVLRALNPASNTTVATSADQGAELEAPTAVSGGSDSQEPTADSNEAGPPLATTSTVPTTTPTPTTTMAGVPSAPDATAYAAAARVDLGVVTTPAQLRDRVLGAVDAQQASGPPPTAPPDRATDEAAGFVSCGELLQAVDTELGPLLALGTGTYQGQPAAVYAFAVDQVAHPAANGSVRIYAVDPATCSVRSVQTVR